MKALLIAVSFVALVVAALRALAASRKGNQGRDRDVSTGGYFLAVDILSAPDFAFGKPAFVAIFFFDGTGIAIIGLEVRL